MTKNRSCQRQKEPVSAAGSFYLRISFFLFIQQIKFQYHAWFDFRCGAENIEYGTGRKLKAGV